jgi:hypothetical protein
MRFPFHHVQLRNLAYQFTQNGFLPEDFCLDSRTHDALIRVAHILEALDTSRRRDVLTTIACTAPQQPPIHLVVEMYRLAMVRGVVIVVIVVAVSTKAAIEATAEATAEVTTEVTTEATTEAT